MADEIGYMTLHFTRYSSEMFSSETLTSEAPG